MAQWGKQSSSQHAIELSERYMRFCFHFQMLLKSSPLSAFKSILKQGLKYQISLISKMSDVAFTSLPYSWYRKDNNIIGLQHVLIFVFIILVVHTL